MKRQTFSVLYYIKRTKLLKNGEAPVYVRITVNGDRVELSLKRSIKSNLWNEHKGRAKGNSKHSSVLNEYLESYKTWIYTIQKEILDKGIPVTAKEIQKHLLGRNEENKGILQLFSEHNEKCRQLIGIDFVPGTVTRYETCFKHLRDFIQTKYNKSDIPLRQVNNIFITDFRQYLKIHRHCRHNTTNKYLLNFKKVIRIALDNHWITVDPFRNIKLRMEEVETPYLTMDELQKILSMKIYNERVSRVRDIFIFCCFTGLAYSDVKELCPDHIKVGEKGNTCQLHSVAKSNESFG